MARMFTKSEPCNKADIHNCFIGTRGYTRKPVTFVTQELGKRVYGLLLQNGRIRVTTDGNNIEHATLTDEGREWLRKGVLAYMRNHPDKADTVIRPPKA